MKTYQELNTTNREQRPTIASLNRTIPDQNQNQNQQLLHCSRTLEEGSGLVEKKSSSLSLRCEMILGHLCEQGSPSLYSQNHLEPPHVAGTVLKEFPPDSEHFLNSRISL